MVEDLSARSQGAKFVTGGSRVGDQGYFVQPTVLTDTNPDMSVVREEIFGPVVCAIPFDDDDLDRIARTANDTSYVSLRAFGLGISALPTSSPAVSRPVRSGSTPIISVIRRCRSVATK